MKSLAFSLRGVGISFPMDRSFRANHYWALEHVDADIPRGAKLGVVGRNGSGKSTLLRILAGALVPDRGSVVRDHGGVQLLSLGLGFVPGLTGRDNAVLGGLLLGFDRMSITRQLETIKAFSELGDFFEQPISTYSTGMLGRLAFSVAIQFEPDVLLIDETLSVGDAAFSRKAHDALMHSFLGDTTVVLVSHDPATISRLCNQVLWLESGRSVACGPVDAVLRAYLGAPADVPSPSTETKPIPTMQDCNDRA